LLALVYVLANPIRGFISADTQLTSHLLLQILLLTLAVVLPFFFSGLVVSLAVTHFREEIDRVYFYDLAGASLAALLAGSLLSIFGAPSLVLAIAVCSLVGAALLSRPTSTGWIALGGAVLLLLLNLSIPILVIPPVKEIVAGTIQFEKWNAFSRVTVDDTFNVRIDASASTGIVSARSIGRVPWHRDIRALAHVLFPDGAGHVLVIGPGGGVDVATALGSRAKFVTGVEINDIIIEDVANDRYQSQSGGLYLREDVRIVIDDGRSFIRRSEERFDIIQATLVDTWAATAAGAFALTENTLYTVEAFQDYYEHLTDAGVVTMTRWVGFEDERLVVLASAALERLGVPIDELRTHLYYARDRDVRGKPRRGTLIAKREPFTAGEVAALDARCKERGFEIALSPSSPGDGRLAQLVAAGAYSPFVRDQALDLSPPTDDRPFFFYFLKRGDMFDVANLIGRGQVHNPAFWILMVVGTSLVGFTLVFILVPLLLHGRSTRDPENPSGRLRPAALAYFVLIGLGFIVAEIAFLQRLTLFLGHPSYSLLVVLFSLLVATAVGARLSGRVRDGGFARAAGYAGITVAMLCFVYASWSGPILTAWVAWPLAARIVVSAIFMGVTGVAMGVMLPSGVRFVAELDADLVPWGWGLNGAASVVGSVIATVLALQFGFTVTLASAGALYALGGSVAWLLASAGRETHRETRRVLAS
jgi:hypothetical protein